MSSTQPLDQPKAFDENGEHPHNESADNNSAKQRAIKANVPMISRSLGGFVNLTIYARSPNTTFDLIGMVGPTIIHFTPRNQNTPFDYGRQTRITAMLVSKIALFGMAFAFSASATAQQLGVGDTGIDEALQLPIRHNPLGTAAPNEKKSKTDPWLNALPLHSRAMFELAKEQQGNIGQAVELSGGDVP